MRATVLLVCLLAACGSPGAVSCPENPPASTCTDSADCSLGDVCCVLPVAGAGNACVPEACCTGVIACRPDEMTCQAFDSGGCYIDPDPPGNHCANY